MRIFFISLVIATVTYAENINQLITKSLKNHQSLKAIELRLSASDDYISRSQKLENPNISLTVNDIQLDDIDNRSIEPMQWTAIKAKQKFPWSGKLDAKKDYQIAKKNVYFDSLEDAKVKLAEAIRLSAYTIDEIDDRIVVLQKYEKVTKENIDLNTAYTSTQSAHHSGIIFAELALSNIKIRIEKLKSIKEVKKAELEYLVQDNIKSVNITDSMHRPKSLTSYLKRVDRNRAYHTKKAQAKVAQTNNKISDLAKYPDPYVEIGYFDRKEYKNYASVSIGMSMPIYGSETLTSQATHKEAISAQSEAIDYRYKVESQIKGVYAQLLESYRIYNIIKNDSLPQIKHSFELNSASVQSGGDLFAYMDILKQKLTLDEQLIAAKGDYFRREAKLKSLIGEIR